MDLKKMAADNLAALKANPYPGRLIIAGMDEIGKNLVQVYALMGRSPKSRNRFLVLDPKKPGKVKVEVAFPSLLGENEDLSLIIYTAMDQEVEDNEYGRYVVTNGAHTDAALENHLIYLSGSYSYEPDKPNYTPRIASDFNIDFSVENSYYNRIAGMCLLKRSPFAGEKDSLDNRRETDVYIYTLETAPGFGYCIHTYTSDGNPLPSFKGDPYIVPLAGDIEQIARMIWDNLNEENLISLAVKLIDISTGEVQVKIINKYGQVKE